MLAMGRIRGGRGGASGVAQAGASPEGAKRFPGRREREESYIQEPNCDLLLHPKPGDITKILGKEMKDSMQISSFSQQFKDKLKQHIARFFNFFEMPGKQVKDKLKHFFEMRGSKRDSIWDSRTIPHKVKGCLGCPCHEFKI
jgi:hypothetical protein